MVVEPLILALGAAALTAVGQVLLAPRRDLSPVPVALCGAALVLARDPGPTVWGPLGVTLFLTALGARRSVSVGVARPELAAGTAAVAALVLAIGAAVPWFPGLRAGLVGALLLAGGLASAVSVARLGAPRPQIRWTGELPVEGGASRAGGPT